MRPLSHTHSPFIDLGDCLFLRRALAVCYDMSRFCYSRILSQEEALLTASLAWRAADMVFQQITAKSLVTFASLSRKRAYEDVYDPKKLNPPLGYPLESVGETQRSQTHQWHAENNQLFVSYLHLGGGSRQDCLFIFSWLAAEFWTTHTFSKHSTTGFAHSLSRLLTISTTA